MVRVFRGASEEDPFPSPPPAASVDKGGCTGGSTLSLLHDKTFNYTGDSQAQELCLYLTKAASVPYFEILEKWIYRGIINDPYRCVRHAGLFPAAVKIKWV